MISFPDRIYISFPDRIYIPGPYTTPALWEEWWAAWPKGKPRPDEDKEKIARGKRGIPDEPEVRRAKSEGQKRRRLREKEEKK